MAYSTVKSGRNNKIIIGFAYKGFQIMFPTSQINQKFNRKLKSNKPYIRQIILELAYLLLHIKTDLVEFDLV